MSQPSNSYTASGARAEETAQGKAGRGRGFPPDLDRLLRPISDDEPAGPWLRYDETYDAIQEARRADDPSLPQGIWERELKKADWEAVATLCEEAIATRSKDLYLAIWLIEAWLHRHGVAGVAVGLELLVGLTRDFWDVLYPRIDPDDSDVRAAPFEWLNDRLPIALGYIPISRPESPDVHAYAWGELTAARAGASAGRREPWSPNVPAEERPNSVKIQASVSLTPAPWLRGLADQIDAALDATARLIALLQERAPEAPPSVRRIEEALQDMQRWITSVVQERPRQVAGVSVAPAAPAAPGAPNQIVPPLDEEEPAMPLAEGGVVRNREEAYHLLAIAAEYLMRTEPHSPTPYLVQRAVNWGRMPLAELLEEYSHDGNDLRNLRILLGLGESV